MNMLFTTEWLSGIFSSHQVKSHRAIEEVATDSRKQTKNALFIPLIGEHFDGHDFVHMAIKNGAIALLWDESKPLPEDVPEEILLFYVPNTLTGLQTLAKRYVEKVNPIVVGITGSNGKTTTKDLVAAVATSSYETHYTDGNLNNHIGVPLTILSMIPQTELLVLEMGMNDFGEIELLSNIAQPDYAMIVNIGESHIEFLKSREGIVKAKIEILAGMKDEGFLIIDGDEPLLKKVHNRKHVISCGLHDLNDVKIKYIKTLSDQTSFQLSNGHTYAIPLLGKHNVHNATFAITLGELLGISQKKMKERLGSLKITSMRMELREGRNGVSIINDAYNASPT